jgi:soluble lytic murein transglycosylase-like protein
MDDDTDEFALYPYDERGDDGETWSEARPWKRRVLIGTLVTVLLAFGGCTAFVFTRLDGVGPTDQVADNRAASAPASPTARQTPSAAPTETRTGTPEASSRSTGATPTRSIKPPKETQLPPPPPPPQAPACPPHFNGKNADKSVVRTALTEASQRAFSRSVPSLRIPKKLLFAVAWQESGWQSAIIACDGGIGTMQVMPDTAVWMNNTYETDWDVNSVRGNVMLGGQLLAWLTKYFGDQLGTYDLNAADTTLLDAVISAYNVGPGAVDLALGRDGIVNWQYVGSVKGLLNNCPCA